jgi:pantetheine-phosphate adenylyltransferase
VKRRHSPAGGHGLAIYPGSFDPLTRGHLDIIQRTSRIFDAVIVAVIHNPAKRHTFSVAERLRMAEDAIRHIPNTRADTYSGLLVDFLKARKARVLIRGLRVVSDMDYEFQLAEMNRRLWSTVETVFLMPDDKYTYLSSSMVKELAQLGAPVDEFVTPFVARQLARKFAA